MEKTYKITEKVVSVKKDDEDKKICISDFTEEKLQNYIESIGEKKFHAKQIFKWLHRFKVKSFDEMTDISKSLREKLKTNTYIYTIDIITVEESKMDGTMKFLLKLKDSSAVEAVLMKYSYGNSLCVSTQVGCKMGCKFCASTKDGFVRGLTPSEIEEQIHVIEKYSSLKISNLVFMGIGEPLDNFYNVLDSIKIINSPSGLYIGARHISLSTCGIVPKIYELADLNMQCTLSISLHATKDKVRQEIMPIAKVYSIKELLDACKYYIKKTNRRISFEFALISSVNDDRKTAEELLTLLRGMIAHVNLIPINQIKNGIYKKPDRKNVEIFMDVLNRAGIVATVRRELGSDISAACGQLRKKYIENEENI